MYASVYREDSLLVFSVELPTSNVYKTSVHNWFVAASVGFPDKLGTVAQKGWLPTGSQTHSFFPCSAAPNLEVGRPFCVTCGMQSHDMVMKLIKCVGYVKMIQTYIVYLYLLCVH